MIKLFKILAPLKFRAVLREYVCINRIEYLKALLGKYVVCDKYPQMSRSKI